MMGSLGGIVASRCARAWTLASQCFTLSREQRGGMAAVQLGLRALQRGEVDVAVIGAVGVAGDARQQLAEALHISERAQLSTEWSEGAVATALMRGKDTERGLPIIAAISEHSQQPQAASLAMRSPQLTAAPWPLSASLAHALLLVASPP